MKNSRGYTLVEMLLVVAIVGLVSTMVTSLLIGMTQFWRQSSARNVIQQDVRVSLDLIDRYVRQAQGGTVVIDQITGQPPFSRITFTTIQGWNISFYQTANKLYMSNNSHVSLLSSNLAYIAFSYPHTDDTTLISVAMTTQALTYQGQRKALQLSIQKVRIMN
jgi:prepilin-type N-terminal cleavage/methylation domain-containing protein